MKKESLAQQNSILVSRLFRSVLLVNISSMVSSIACLMVDAIVTGQFLGSDAVASMGLIQPVVRICSLIGPIFGIGLGIVCTRYMGMARLDRVNQVFSVVVSAVAAFSVAVAAALFAFAPVVAGWLGGNAHDPAIIRMITDYFRGFSPGIPFFIFSIILPGLLMIDNDRRRGMMAVLLALVVDTAADLMNVTMFHGGMFGMAFASTLSNIAGFLLLASHFFRKDRALHFVSTGMRISDLKEVFLNGVPNAISSGSTAIRMMIFNSFLLVIASKAQVSAFSAADSSFSIVLAVLIAFYMSTSTVCSLYFGEEDRNGIVVVLDRSMRMIMLFMGIVMIAMLVFAEEVGEVFLRTDDRAQIVLTAFFIRFMAVEFFLTGISYSQSGAYQGTGRMESSYLLVALREAVFPIICVLLMGALFGTGGVGAGLAMAGLLTGISCLALPAFRRHKSLSVKAEELILLDEDFGCRPEDAFGASFSDMEGVMAASRDVMTFCRDRRMDHRTGVMVSLFIEELCGNTIRYGYQDGKEKMVDVRVVCSGDRRVIRIKDTAAPFDPVEWYRKNHPEDPSSGIGIRMVAGLAKDVRYVPAMGLNNLMLIL